MGLEFPLVEDQFAGRTLVRSAAQARSRLIELSHARGVPHLASALSCIDILVELYWRQLAVDPACPNAPGRDVFILSKGHAAPALYVILAMRGFFPVEWLDDLGRAGSPLGEQPIPGAVPGVEAATGSLGHGLSLALGFALSSRLAKRSRRVIALLSDGECNEGSVWEAAMMAPARSLHAVTVIVDHNKWQATDRTRDVLAVEPLAQKFSAFGWRALEVDGHDFSELHRALSTPPEDNGVPTAVIAHTVKGKGVTFMEDDNNWHYRIPTADEVRAACGELQENMR